MDISFSDLKEKEIINVFDGRKLGRIVDLLFDGSSGVVRGIVVPGERKMFRRNDDVFISLDRIRKIGDDVILISFPVQNQNVFTGQLSNLYADTYMPSQIGYSKNKKIKNSGNYYSQNSKLKNMTRSSLEKIPGIGEKKAKALLKAMSLSDIRIASEEELERIDGIGKKDAAAIYGYFRSIENEK